MADLTIKPQGGPGNKLIIQDQAGNPRITTSDAGIDIPAVTGNFAAAGNVTSTGNLTVAGDIIPSSPLSHRNMIINGGMQVWQRATSSTAWAKGTFPYLTADRWLFAGHTSLDQYACTLSQGTVDGDALLEGHKYSFKVQTTTPETAAEAGEELHLRQIIEAQNLQHLAYGTASAKTTTLSFWVKSSVTGTFAFSIYQADGVRDIGATYTINSANTFEKKTITIAGDTGGTINNDNGQGLYLRWCLLAGADMKGTANSTWAAGADARFATGHTNTSFHTTDNATWEITGVQFEVGSNATPFEHRSYGDELLRCKRYYQRKQGGISNGHSNGSGAVYGIISYEEMRAAPTITSSGTLYWNDASAQVPTTYNVAYWISTIGCSVGYTGTATANRSMTVYSAVSGNNGLALVAEL